MRCALSTRQVREENLPRETIRGLLEAIRAEVELVPERRRNAMDLAELRAVRAALRKLEEGNYGACENCHGAIPVHYLLALPLEARCERCRTDHA
jgi:RNA polymerase-binding transcription factor DksA